MEKYLRKCLDSLIMSDENMQRLEVLVINDGSKDSSSLIAHEYASNYPQTFRVVDKENGNYGSCVNYGLKEASGKYVKILDADDSFDNGVFERYLSYLSRVDVDLVISDFNIINVKGKATERCTFNLPKDRVFSLATLDDNTIEWLWHHAIAYKTCILRNMQYRQTEGISYTDDEWIFKPMAFVESVSYFPEPLYYYLRGREGQTFDPIVLRKTFDHRIKVAHSMIDFYKQINGRCSDVSLGYLSSKLQKRLKDIYLFCLTWNDSKELREQLVAFDKCIKNGSMEVYSLTNEVINGYGWHFIKGWRNANYKQTLALRIMRFRKWIEQK